MSRTAAQVGAANRTRGKDTERKVAAHLCDHGLGDGHRNLAGYARDHGDYGPVTDCDGDRWAVEIKGPTSQPTPGQVEAWAAEAAREAEHAGVPLWVLIVRRPGTKDVGLWWAWLPLEMLWPSGGGDLACVTLRTWVALVAPEAEVVA